MLDPVASEADLPDLVDGFALRDRLVRLAQTVLRADELAVRRCSFGTAEVYLAEVRHGVSELLQLVDHGGWPSVRLVGQDGLDAALVLAQSASLEEQFALRPALAKVVQAGGAPESHLVHLAALIARATGAPIDDGDRFVPRTNTWSTAAPTPESGAR
ncbi:hypothetical protein ACFC58_06870 [Kitasatospora purpeofusca]|uniref:hypothetical protein n=1 Tax=Kitasatospora purpeofusca TaxID=67352 RepID=UPI0035D990DF